MMRSTWVDSRLGQFGLDDYLNQWKAVVVVPAFDVFDYSWGNELAIHDSWVPDYPLPNSRYDLIIDDQNGATDKSAAVTLALKALGNQVALVEALTAAMWEDINGRGPDTGMWWHVSDDRGFCTFDELGDSGYRLYDPADLLKLMRLSEIVVRNDVKGCEDFLIEMRFDAVFEREHGVGILTDGDRILGIGYQFDVTLFRHP